MLITSIFCYTYIYIVNYIYYYYRENLNCERIEILHVCKFYKSVGMGKDHKKGNKIQLFIVEQA